MGSQIHNQMFGFLVILSPHFLCHWFEGTEERQAYSCACAHERAREFGIDLAHTLI
jgi:hypothetical protein